GVADETEDQRDEDDPDYLVAGVAQVRPGIERSGQVDPDRERQEEDDDPHQHAEPAGRHATSPPCGPAPRRIPALLGPPSVSRVPRSPGPLPAVRPAPRTGGGTRRHGHRSRRRGWAARPPRTARRA